MFNNDNRHGNLDRIATPTSSVFLNEAEQIRRKKKSIDISYAKQARRGRLFATVAAGELLDRRRRRRRGARDSRFKQSILLHERH